MFAMLSGMDTKFASATPVWSQALFVERQGVAICLSNTAIDYSISLGLVFHIAINVDVHMAVATCKWVHWIHMSWSVQSLRRVGTPRYE